MVSLESLAPLADLVREVAAGHPEAVAVEAPEASLTYRELVDAADALASGLRDAGAATVAVTGRRGTGFVVAVLAAMTAPVRLVTVDPELPAARRVFMTERAAADLVLVTDETSATGLPAELPVHRITSTGEVLDALPVHAGEPGVGSYIFFTSGTTGTPKAVVGRQSAIAHFVRWQRDRFAIGPGDRFAQLTALSFDVVLRDVFTPLAAGATICVPPDNVAVHNGGIIGWLREAGITVVHTVPSLAARWLATAAPAREQAALRLSFLAGEPLPDTTVTAWRQQFPHTRVVNLYGPTETTLAKFSHEIGEPVPGIQPVGRPLPETDFRLVDEEVWISTPHRTGGYLDDPDETARRFVSESGEVWYRTGDLGVVDGDGLLHLRGRADFQVKINGNRVELEGLTALLRGHREVRDAVVTARTRPDGATYLAAYYVGAAAGEDLRTWLGERLPAAQVPSVFLSLPQLPLAANGKIDRSALPDPLATGPESHDRESLDSVGRAVFDAFEAVLGSVSADADFFVLGGTSLDSAELSTRLLNATGRRIEMREIYQLRTPANLLAAVRARAADEQAPIPRREPVATTGLSPQQRRYRNVFLPEGNRTWANMPALFTLPDGTDAAAVHRALGVVVDRHDSLRAWFDGDVQHFADSVDFTVETVDLSHLSEEQYTANVDRLRIAESYTLLPTAAPPLFRATLVRFHDRATLLWNVHHLVSDGFSQQLFRRELTAVLGGTPPEKLPPLPISYRDYIAWRAERGDDPAPREYWREVFADRYERPLLPVRHAVEDPARGVAYQFPIDDDLTAQVDRFARAQGVTAFSVYFAAYFLLVHELYGRADLVVATPAAGRTRPEFQHLIGNFISLVGIRHRSGEENSFTDLVQRLQERTVRAMENQDYQYDQVMADVGAEPDDDRFPLTTVAISLMDVPPDQAATLRRPSYRDLGCGVKFDLLGYLRRAGESAAFDLHTRYALMDEAQLHQLREEFLGLLRTNLADV
ncbi:amino acid adenylation domain-containing protein [Amycolatopsis pithecellobii]|uniref:AMP-binding protein n=1 Tax=Amycolatopsis pithecellobii TaxID=664692 RepID=A0A6N7Z2G9_9PSEU|nr:amino acid adenylation domain-containing protein [Amycolatopsis pithecellobii]MTD55853.1 AMP-binding protein [Amycolatopsis pithecellobii]